MYKNVVTDYAFILSTQEGNFDAIMRTIKAFMFITF